MPESHPSAPEPTGRFAYDGLERVFHEKARLGIMTSLVTNSRGVVFADLKEMCNLTDGNLSRHLQILLDALNHYAATETVVLLGLCARLSTANQGTQHSGLRADEDGGAQA